MEQLNLFPPSPKGIRKGETRHFGIIEMGGRGGRKCFIYLSKIILDRIKRNNQPLSPKAMMKAREDENHLFCPTLHFAVTHLL